MLLSHTSYSAGVIALSAVLISTRAQGAIVPPPVFDTFNLQTLYYMTVEEVSGASRLEVGDHIWFGVEYNKAHTDVAPDSFAFHSNDIFAGNGFGAVVVDDGIEQQTAFITGGQISAFQGFPIADSVGTYATGGFFLDYGNLNYIHVTLSGPKGTFTVPLGEDLALSHMINTKTVNSFTDASFSARFGGSIDISGSVLNVYIPTPSQVVYIDFSESVASYQNPFETPSTKTYLKPAFDGTAADEAAVLAAVASIFEDYNIEIVGEQPLSGSYSTVWVGGSHSDNPDSSKLGYSVFTKGAAEKIDFDNQSSTDNAVVFSENIYGGILGPSRNDRLSHVIAHEIGHALGLFHINDASQLMYPESDDAPVIIGGKASTVFTGYSLLFGSTLHPILDSYGQPITQDSAACLSASLNQATDVGECFSSNELRDVIENRITNTLSIGLYDVRLVVIADREVSPSLYELGSLGAGQSVVVELPKRFGEEFFLAASTVPGGDYDIFTLSDEADVASFTPTINTVSSTRPLTEKEQGVINLVSIANGPPSIVGTTLVTVLGTTCKADVNGDGVVSPTDFTSWVAAFNSVAPECDQNGDGSCTPTDFTAWIANYNAGC